jgi:rhomboid protease GluP
MKAPPISPEEFAERIHRYTPKAWVTPMLIGLNAAVYVAMLVGGANPLSPSVPDIVHWGANVASLSLGAEPWRLFTCMFVHIGLLHIAMNMYVLWDIGRFVEKLLGNAGMLIVYLLSGLAGSLASAAIHPNVVSAGASGAIFGLYGVVFGYLVRNRSQVPTQTLRQLRKVAGIFVVFNIALGFIIPAVDVSAHLGGLAAGFVFGFLISGSLTEAGVARRTGRNLLTAGVGLIALVLIQRALPSPVNFGAELRQAAAMTDRLETNYEAADAKLKRQQLSGPDMAKLIQSEIRPPWEATLAHLNGLRLQGHDDLVRRALVRYMQARDRSYDLAAQYFNDPQISGLAAIQKQRQECARLERAIAEALRGTPKP